jgi:hypothetical protein
MFATAAGNTLVAIFFTGQWPLFVTIAAASKVVMFAIQYAVIRSIVMRRKRAASGGAEVTSRAALAA